MPERKKLRDRIIARYYKLFIPKAYDEEKGEMPDLVANDQHPEILFVSCIDSRTAPNVIFKMNPGEALSHRHVAGLIPPYNPDWENGANPPAVAAAIDFAVSDKKVSNIIIMGHTLCGGIKAYIEGSASPLVKAWMENVSPILDKIDSSLPREELLRQAEKECIKYSFHNLMTYPAVRKAMTNGTLNIEAWIDDIENGVLLRFDPKLDDFVEMQADGTDVPEHITNVPEHKCSH